MKVIDLMNIYGHNYRPRGAGIDKFIAHHTAGNTPHDYMSALKAVADADGFVRRERGWPGFPYHGAIWSEYFFRCSNWSNLGWHSAGHDIEPRNGIGDNNDRGVAVALLGDFTHVLPDDETLTTLVQTWTLAQHEIGHELALVGHQDVWVTACPGEWWATAVGALRRRRLGGEIGPQNPDFEPAEVSLINAVGYLSGDVVRIEDAGARIAEANRVREQFGMTAL